MGHAGQHDPDLGHRTGVILTVEYNTPPAINPAARFNGGFPCAESAPYPVLGNAADTLQAMAVDADPDDWGMDYEFAVWPANDPAARTVLTTSGPPTSVRTVRIPADTLVDGRTYSWQVRVSDGMDMSPWSGVCSFVADTVDPQAPEVTSANYPPADAGQGPLGEPGVFTLAATDAETAGFQYGWEMLYVPVCEYGPISELVCPDPFTNPNTVRANAPGGTATVALNPPRWGRNRLLVRSIDRAGRLSDETTYEIFRPFGGEPTITLVGETPEWGEEVTLRFSPYPGITGTVDYAYRINGGPEQTVTPAADGTATITFVASNPSGPGVDVRSRSANGWVSPETTWRVPFHPWPGVRSDLYLENGQPAGGVGVPGTFTFAPPPGWTEVAGYRYCFNYDPFGGGTEFVFVPAGSDNRATITWAPGTSGANNLDVYAVRPDGTTSDPGYYSFQVA